MEPDTSTIDGMLRRSAARYPSTTALRFAERDWTYGELDAAVTRVAAYLHDLGLRKGDRVAYFGTNSDAYVLGYLGTVRAGLVHVPVNFALRGEELNYILSHSGARVVFADPSLTKHVEDVRASASLERVMALRDDGESLLQASIADIRAPHDAFDVSGSDLAQLLYTSGTTSKPKGAMLTHSALVHEYTSCIVDLEFDKADDPLVCMPIYHSGAMHVFLMPYLAVGATVRLLPNPDVAEVLRVIEAERIGSIFLAPTVWVSLANHPTLETRNLDSLRKAQYGASIMPGPVLERLRCSYPHIGFYNAFGQSEIGPLASVLRPHEHDLRPASCGKAALFVEIRVVDTEGNDVPDGQAGEAVYRSPQLCLGYWNDAAATARAFKDGWFHSGDLVKRDAEGYITVVDRIKDVINTGGVLVASSEVEDAIYEHPGIAEAAVIGLPDPKWIEAITAVIVRREGTPAVTADELIAYLKSRLAPFKVPKSVRFTESLPRNSSGKILKRQLREELWSEPFAPADSPVAGSVTGR